MVMLHLLGFRKEGYRAMVSFAYLTRWLVTPSPRASEADITGRFF